MKKAILFILAGFFSVVMAMPLYIPVAQAEGMGDGGMRKKRYRYRRRSHRVQVAVDSIPWSENKDTNMSVSAGVLYGYNFGQFELGPNINISYMQKETALAGGIWGEFNIIKNKRKENLVPSIGVKVNYLQGLNTKLDGNSLLLSPYLSVKYFPASRTGLVLNINYDIATPFDNIFKKMEMGISVSVAYVHYFHM